MAKKLRLGHNYDVTEYYKKVRGQYTDYAKYFICADVWDFHVYRIVIDYNSEYEKEPRTKLVEQGNISKRDVLEAVEEDLDMKIFYDDIRDFPDCLIDGDFNDMGFKSIIKAVVDLDDGDNFDLKEYRFDTDIEKLINDINAGYGITVLDVYLNELIAESEN